ncbi:MAG: superoxide dismutase [Fibrobacterales bacterium]
MSFTLPELPYAPDALEPTISKETIEFHYGKHHQAYVTNLNKLIEGTEFANATLESIIAQATGGIFNNAAQVWNHTFYWNCLTPSKTEPTDSLLEAINASFGSVDTFKEQFSTAAATNFGSGWTWLVKNSDESLEIISTSNADTPIKKGAQVLLTIDVWEHAYYVDYRNARPKYIAEYWNLVNWKFVSKNFE